MCIYYKMQSIESIVLYKEMNQSWFQFCNPGVEHKRKDAIDKHLCTAKQLKNKTTDINSPFKELYQHLKIQ